MYSLFAGEDVDADHVDLGVAVLAGLGGGHFDDLARTSLQHDVTIFAQRRALHREGGGRTGVSGLEVGILHFGHGCWCWWWRRLFLGSTKRKTQLSSQLWCVRSRAASIYTGTGRYLLYKCGSLSADGDDLKDLSYAVTGKRVGEISCWFLKKLEWDSW